jgi:ribosome-associated translation inhibitor RaiA
MTVIQIELGEGVPRGDADALRTGILELTELQEKPVSHARITLRRGLGQHGARHYVADASVIVDGRTIAAHAMGGSANEATKAVRNRLRRQLHRVLNKARDQQRRGVTVAPLPRNLSYRPQEGVKPAPLRRIVHRRTYLQTPLGTVEAVDDLLDIDGDFMLFVHARTHEDVVVYLRDDGRIGLLFPEGSRLADEDDIVVPKPSRYPAPIFLSAARTEMDFLDHRFLYFTDAADGRGQVIYLRHDGDYGLVEPR